MIYPLLKKGHREYKLTMFPAFTPSTILYGGKARRNVIDFTGICFLDADHIRNEQRLENIMKRLRSDEHVILAYKSASGRGLHILIRYELDNLGTLHPLNQMGTTGMQKLYKRVFDYISREYQEKLCIKTDSQAGHLEHMCIISHDPERHYNPSAEPIKIDVSIWKQTREE